MRHYLAPGSIALVFAACILPTVLFGQDKIVFREDFNDNHNQWFLGEFDAGETEIDDGNYTIEKTTEDGYWFFWLDVPINTEQDFTIETRLRQTSGTEKHGYGLIWGTYDVNNYYAFIISPGATKLYENYNDTVYFSDEEWKDNKYVKGMNEWNTVTIRKDAQALTTWVNGKYAGYGTFTGKEFMGKKLGFVVNKNMKIEIDYIEVRERPTPSLKIVAGSDRLSSKPENLGSAVNSPYTEILDFVTADGKTIYYNRSNHPDNLSPIEECDIWVAHRLDDGSWGKVEHPYRPLNNQSKNITIAATPDENMLVLQNRFNTDGSSAGKGLSVSYRTSSGWTQQQDLEVGDNYNYGNTAEYCLSPDSRVLMGALERDDTRGKKDLYVSFRKADGSFSAWKNCGDINTIGQESGPFIAADGQTMYFATDGRQGYGGLDIFVSRRLDESWTNWSEPENLGPIINNRRFNAYYMVSGQGDWAYYTSAGEGTLGEEDIFRIKLPEAAKPKPVLIVSGRVLNSKTSQPVGADVFYEFLPKGEDAGIARSNPANGQYKISLPVGSDYGFRASAKGYYPVSEQLNTKDLKEYAEITRDLYLTPIEVNQPIRLNNIFFDFAKYDLRSESYPELNRLLEFLRDNASVEIELRGHTDNVGSDVDNNALSQNRVNAVRTYLLGQGVTAERIRAKGFGESAPIATNDTDEGRQFNRRVEFVILKQ